MYRTFLEGSASDCNNDHPLEEKQDAWGSGGKEIFFIVYFLYFWIWYYANILLRKNIFRLRGSVFKVMELFGID